MLHPTRIRILYPFQDFDRFTFGYESSALETALATTVDVQAYVQVNERQLQNDIFIDIGPVFGPGPSSDVQADSLNFTDLETFGFRAELTKIIGLKHSFTYGAEYYEDDSFELFNLREDLGERNDLAAAHPERVRQLDALMTAWLEETGAKLPIRNPDHGK